jgi:hypothetical protein
MTRLAIAFFFLCATSPAMAFTGNAVPHPDPQCTISDDDPPTNVRTQPNGLIIGNLHNGDAIRIVDQTRALIPGRWPVGGLWDFVFVAGEGGGLNSPYGWVYDDLVQCH